MIVIDNPLSARNILGAGDDLSSAPTDYKSYSDEERLMKLEVKDQFLDSSNQQMNDYSADLAQQLEKDDLMVACKNGNFSRVRELLEKGSDVNTQMKDGRSALMLACENGDTSIVQMLLDFGSDVEAQMTDGQTALMIACKNGNTFIIQELLKMGSNLKARMKDGYTALHIASVESNLEVLKLLLSSGADLNCEDYDGCTPFHVASYVGNLDIMRVIVATGRFKYNSYDYLVRSALHVLEENGEDMQSLSQS